MDHLRLIVGMVAVTWITILATAASGRQVDQEWLRQWKTAQVDRPAALETAARIASEAEPGSGLIVDGQVYQPDGMTAAPNVIVFAYQTDRDGLYAPPRAAAGTWRLRGWARTGPDGRFRFRTIRPGVYPDRSEPAHIHFTVESSAYGRQWAPTLMFADDPLVSDLARRRSRAAGRFGPVAELVGGGHGMARVELAIRLKTRPDF